MTEPDKNKLRQYLKFIESLLRAMDVALQTDDSENVWKYSGFKQFARKYMQIVNLMTKRIELPPIVDFYDIEKMPARSSTRAYSQKEIFKSVYANLALPYVPITSI